MDTVGTVETNESIIITRYNNDAGLDISIIDPDTDEVGIFGDDVLFLYKTLGNWISEFYYKRGSDASTKS